MSTFYVDLPLEGGSSITSWKAPVTTVGDLPAVGNTVGDARVVTDNDAIFVWGGDSTWHGITGGNFLARDGSNSPTATIDWGGHQITGISQITTTAGGYLSAYHGVTMGNGSTAVTIGSDGIHLATPKIIRTSDGVGLATLVGGTVVVANTNVDSNSRIFLSVFTPGGTPGFLSYSIVNNTSFTITSSSALDTSVVAWLIIAEGGN